jgi:hypothetical protein
MDLGTKHTWSILEVAAILFRRRIISQVVLARALWVADVPTW